MACSHDLLSRYLKLWNSSAEDRHDRAELLVTETSQSVVTSLASTGHRRAIIELDEVIVTIVKYLHCYGGRLTHCTRPAG